MIYVDTNVILDVVEPSKVWRRWSEEALERGRSFGPMVAGPVVVGELAGRGAPREVVLNGLAVMAIRPIGMDADAGYRAGVALRDYRLAGGTREKMIADFLIGAHAAVLGATLLTRDAGPFRRYFPELRLITPQDDDG